MTDIVERLRYLYRTHPIVIELADEVERLRTGNRLHLELAEIKEAEIKMLREHCDRMASLAIDNAKDTERALKQAEEIERLREALHMIVCNTEPDAIKHRNYDHLAKNIHDCASAALKEKE